MNRIKNQTALRPRSVDDLMILQGLFENGVESQLTDLGSFLISGGVISGSATNANITKATFFIEGKLCQLEAVTGYNFVASGTVHYIILSALVESTPKFFEASQTNASGTKNTQAKYSALLVDATTFGASGKSATNSIKVTFASGFYKKANNQVFNLETGAGLLPPRFTTAQRTALAGLGSLGKGAVIFDTDLNIEFIWNGTAFVENSIASFDYKAGCIVATDANITLSNTQTIQSVALIAGDRVLVNAQSTATNNGIYIVVSGGAWTRATDFDANCVITEGTSVKIQKGTYADGTFKLNNKGTGTNGRYALGTDAVNFTIETGIVTKKKKLVVTAPTSTAVGSYAHGLTVSKIIGITAFINYNSDTQKMCPAFNSAGFLFYLYFDSTNVFLDLQGATSLASQSATILIDYEP